MQRFLADVDAIEDDAAPAGPQQASDTPAECCLAGPFGPSTQQTVPGATSTLTDRSAAIPS